MLTIIISLLGLALLFYFIGFLDWSGGKKPLWGATFSQLYAQYLGLNWQEAYLAILDDLNPQAVRLIAYWSVTEATDDNFNFSDLDWQVEQASQRDKKIILAVGQKAPRWPECHQPNWINSLDKEKQQEQILQFIAQTINRYKNNKNITYWQVENEPLIDFFGKCPAPNKKFLEKEIALVKSLDARRPIMITDSGELSLWTQSAGLSEILGATLYRTVWHKWLGIVKHYQYNPLFYRLRAELAKRIKGNQKVIIAELQAEPWGSKNRSLTEMPAGEQLKDFSLNDLKGNLEFARKTGLPEIYLWGCEWTWWLKAKQNNSSYWNLMKEAIK